MAEEMLNQLFDGALRAAPMPTMRIACPARRTIVCARSS